MSGLENLTTKIIADAKKRADEITAEAERQAKASLDLAEAEVAREKERVLTEAQAQAAHTAEQITLGKTLAVRDQNLEAKQETLEKVFAAAAEKLNGMSQADYEKYLISCLKNINTDGGELILPRKYKIDIESLNAELEKAGGKGGLALSTAQRPISGGFILCNSGIEQNNTFESLIDYCRYELEGEVLKMLY